MWKQRETTAPITEELRKEFNLSPTVASLFASRGITSEEDLAYWLNGTLDDLADPFLFNEMDKTVQRIMAAIDAEEQITIYGDYDADGITSTAVLVETLEIIGAKVNYYIPSRFADGYGPNLNRYQQLAEAGTQLLITVDNGITGKKAVESLVALGVDVIITDHHTIPENIPNAFSIIHPKLSGEGYPFHDFSGVGVAYTLARALMDGDPLEDLLDLVAIGTIADMVPLLGENHLLVKYGLMVLQQNNRLGLNELFEIAKLNPATISAQDVSFGIAPKLNSIGRLSDANKAVELLLADDKETAVSLAKELDEFNNQRKQISEKGFQDAVTIIDKENLLESKTLVVYGTNFHEGVLGIIASRLVQEYHRPTIVLTNDDEGNLKGSGRSVPGFNIFNALQPLSPKYLLKFGGHTMACGLSLVKENLAEFRQAFAETYKISSTESVKLYDTTINEDAVSVDLYHELQVVGPFGESNEEPIFKFEKPQLTNFKQIGSEKQYFKANMTLDSQNTVEVLSFNLQNYDEHLLPFVANIFGQISINEWRNTVKVQILILDFGYQLPAQLNRKVVDLRNEQQTLHIGDTYVFYHKRIAERFSQSDQVDLNKIILLDNQEELPAVNLGRAALMELPPSPSHLKQIFSKYQFEQVLLKFNYDNILVDQIPEEAVFRNVLKYVYQHPGLDFAAYKEASSYLKANELALKFIFNVFLELNFVKMDKFKIVPNKNVKATALTNSKILLATTEQLSFKSKMMSLSSAELVSYIESLIR